MLTITNLCLDPAREPLAELPLADGAIHVVLGRNRSGKSALCRLLAGLPGPASGEVSYGGESWQGLGPRQRPVAMVYQAFVNYPHWTVAANLASPLRAQGVSPTEIEAQVADLAQRLQLTELLSRLPSELSGGQQQRLAIGRALAKGARVLLLDEPLVNLDYKLREALEYELLDLLKASGATVVYTSSDPKDALGLADNLVLLAEQQVVQTGAPLEVYQHPNSPLAADLLSDPGVNAIVEPEAESPLGFVRPEHLLVERLAVQKSDSQPQDWRRFEMQVQAVETNGSHTFVHGDVEGVSWIAKLRGLQRLDANQRLTLHCRSADVLQFGEAHRG